MRKKRREKEKEKERNKILIISRRVKYRKKPVKQN
jgi:hypothetical protein